MDTSNGNGTAILEPIANHSTNDQPDNNYLFRQAASSLNLLRPTDRDLDHVNTFMFDALPTVNVASEQTFTFDNNEYPYLFIPPLLMPTTWYDIRDPLQPFAYVGPNHRHSLTIPRLQGVRVVAEAWPTSYPVIFKASTRPFEQSNYLGNSNIETALSSLTTNLSRASTVYRNYEHKNMLIHLNLSAVDPADGLELRLDAIDPVIASGGALAVLAYKAVVTLAPAIANQTLTYFVTGVPRFFRLRLFLTAGAANYTSRVDFELQ